MGLARHTPACCGCYRTSITAVDYPTATIPNRHMDPRCASAAGVLPCRRRRREVRRAARTPSTEARARLGGTRGIRPGNAGASKSDVRADASGRTGTHRGPSCRPGSLHSAYVVCRGRIRAWRARQLGALRPSEPAVDLAAPCPGARRPGRGPRPGMPSAQPAVRSCCGRTTATSPALAAPAETEGTCCG